MLRIYLDNCCYNRPFDEQDQNLIILETEAKLIIQSKIKKGIHSLVWSFMLDSENDDNPSEEKREVIKPWKMIASEYCSASPDILEKAKEYMKFGLKHKDAIHLACAVKQKCDYLITTDKKFNNKNGLIQDMKIVNPIAFILETEESK
ncbi:MAG: PIN domain-containing protein [Oscillospiraceae bacterium]|nr:PIN domain-containing protein [Oscillospiraceae bacterium]